MHGSKIQKPDGEGKAAKGGQLRCTIIGAGSVFNMPTSSSHCSS